MNITMNSPTLPASADAAVNAAAGTTGPAGGLPLDPALAAAQPGAATPLAFLQFMQLDAALPGEPLPQPELAAAGDGVGTIPAATGTLPAAAEEQEEPTDTGVDAAAQPLLAAMSMPLTPAMMAMPSALPAAMRLGAGMPQRQERAAEAIPAATASGAAVASQAAPAALDVRSAAAGAVPLPAAAQAASQAAAQAAQPAQAPDAGAQLARASAAQAQSAQPTAAPQALAAAAPAAPRDGAGADSQAGTNGGQSGAAADHAGFGVATAAAPAPTSAARDGGTLALSGPPTAWRQSLQEALGERLNLQLTKNAEQAVIRLEPPMLGRVEISIRHAAGSLEVNITATHSEVLRQLNTVSDNLRSDLAGRQYTDVSVNISQAAPRAQAAAQQGTGFGTDAQGRGRQHDQDQDERAPGAALAEANQSTGAFSLSGRA